jgi:hypothetical protein
MCDEHATFVLVTVSHSNKDRRAAVRARWQLVFQKWPDARLDDTKTRPILSRDTFHRELRGRACDRDVSPRMALI